MIDSLDIILIKSEFSTLINWDYKSNYYKNISQQVWY
jgi:hypothetical protein